MLREADSVAGSLPLECHRRGVIESAPAAIPIATRKLTVLVWFALLWLPSEALAKRTPAPVIEPVVHQGVRYTVPNDKGTVGYVVAWDVATGKQLWKKTIFRKCLCPLVEHDVQWVFIKHLRLAGNSLVLVNERGKTYSLDLKTRKVKKLKRKSDRKGGGTASQVHTDSPHRHARARA